MEKFTDAYEVSVGKPEGKRPRCRWENIIRIDRREVG
jgi:hypothetical protein